MTPADSATADDAHAQYLERLAGNYHQYIPHVKATGMTVTEIRRAWVSVELPGRPEWAVDPERGLVNNGIVISLVDSASGLAVYAAMDGPERIATLDLRLDYLRAARCDAPLCCESHCFRLARQIAFVRSRVWQPGVEDDVAVAQGAFMRTST